MQDASPVTLELQLAPTALPATLAIPSPFPTGEEPSLLFILAQLCSGLCHRLFTCLACRPGQFSSQTGVSDCSLCAAGSFSSGNASRTCTSCDPGFVQVRSLNCSISKGRLVGSLVVLPIVDFECIC